MARIRNKAFTDKTGALCWKVGLYIRLSREDGNDVSVSIENQKVELQAFLACFDEPYELIDYYIDDGFSGTNSNRMNFQRLLQDIRLQKVTCVIVRDPSRLSRNYWEAGMYMEQLFVQHNVRFISLLLPPLDSYKNPEAMNSIAVPIQNVINDDFCRQTSAKIRGVFQMKRAHGEFIGAFAPYGYAKDQENKNRLVIDPMAAQIVREIFRWFVYQGMSKRGITIRLNELGIPNPTKYKQRSGLKFQCRQKDNDGLWSPKTVSFILANEVYVGNMVQGRQRIKSYKVHETINVPAKEWVVVENTHEAIIDQHTFAMAQRLQQMDTRTAPNHRELHLFAGFLKCADCGKGMRRSKGKNHVYYCCLTNRNKSPHACTRHSMREDLLEAVVLKMLQFQIARIQDWAKVIEQINVESVNARMCDLWSSMLHSKNREWITLQAVRDDLYIDWKSNALTKEEYERMKSNFAQKAANLETEIEAIKAKIMEENHNKRSSAVFEEFQKHGNISRLDRFLLVCMIERIFIHEDNRITILFRYKDPFLQYRT